MQIREWAYTDYMKVPCNTFFLCCGLYHKISQKIAPCRKKNVIRYIDNTFTLDRISYNILCLWHSYKIKLSIVRYNFWLFSALSLEFHIEITLLKYSGDIMIFMYILPRSVSYIDVYQLKSRMSSISVGTNKFEVDFYIFSLNKQYKVYMILLKLHLGMCWYGINEIKGA
jgi:hypothetical protein